MAKEGEILISSGIDISGFETDSSKLEAAAKRAADSLEETMSNISLNTAKNTLWQEGYDMEEIDNAYKAIEAHGDYVESLEQIREVIDMMRNGETLGFTDKERAQMAKDAAAAERQRAKAMKEAAAAEEKLNKAQKATAKTTKKSTSLFKSGFGTVLKYAIGIRSLYQLVNKLRSAAKEGINNLAQVDDDLNKSLSNMKSATTQLKNSVGSMISPIIQWVEPFITRLLNLLTEAANKAAEVMASLMGQKTFKKAIAVQEDYAAAIEKSQNKLSGLDEISTYGDNGSASPDEMFTTVDIEPNTDGILGYDWDGLVKRVWEKIKTVVTKINWNEIFDIIFEMLGNGFGLISNFIGTAITDLWNTIKGFFDKRTEQFGGNVILGILAGIGDALIGIGKWVTDHIFKPFWNGLWSAFGLGDSPKMTELGQMIINGFTNGIDKIKSWWSSFKSRVTVAMETLKSAIKVPINAIIGFINGLVKAVTSGLNAVIRLLNKLKIDVPSWVTDLTGIKTLGFNIKELTAPQIPMLATGAVIPPNAPFMAMLGDQKSGTNIEAPLDTIREAVADVAGGGTYQFIAQINRKTLFDEMIEEAKIRRTVTGKNPFMA